MPNSFKTYFWDIDSEKLNLEEDYIYIISRLLELGKFESVQWIFNHYSKLDIQDALYNGNVSEQTKEFVKALI